MFRVEITGTSKDRLEDCAQEHRGMFVYDRSFAVRPRIGAHIDVGRYEQAAIYWGATAIDRTREASRTFIVARYDGGEANVPREVCYTDGTEIKPNEERAAYPLDRPVVPTSWSRSSLYLVIERAQGLPHLGTVVKHYKTNLEARTHARKLELELVQKQDADRTAPNRDDHSQDPRSTTEWWRSEGQALRERKKQGTTARDVA